MAIRISALNKKSEKSLLSKMSFEDLRKMAYLSSDVIAGKNTLQDYRNAEKEMITKYNFVIQ